MTLRLLIAGSLLWFATLAARAQSADDFFNGGAQFYISNNIPDALKKVETGRKFYPDDVKLKKLEELLKQQQQQQNKQNQQNQSQQNQNSQKQQSQTKQQQQQNKQQQPQQNSQKQQQSQQQQQQAKNQPQNQNSGQQKQPPMAMTPEEAKRLLDSQKGNEQVLPFSSKNQPENQNPPVKDW